MTKTQKHWRAGAVATVLILAGSGLAVQAQSDATADLPKNATPGMCYARVMIPPVYKTDTERVLKQESSTRIEVIPAKYRWAEEKVLVKEASTRIETVPASYAWVEEKVLVKPAQTVWKKGRGPVEKVDHGTGEIMCLIEEPAVYETVRKRVLKSPATSRQVQVPAEYQTVRKQVVATQASTREIEIPAEYGSVTKRTTISKARLEWKPVLCQTNLGTNVVTGLQRALAGAGHSPGPIDGIIGSQTMAAVESYQRAKGLATGGLTMETLNRLNVRVK